MSKKAPLNLKIWQFLWSWHGLWYHLHHFLPREQNISIVGVFWASLKINVFIINYTFIFFHEIFFLFFLRLCDAVTYTQILIIRVLLLFFSETTPPISMKLCIHSKGMLILVLGKFHEIPFTNKKVACRRQAMQRVVNSQ